MPRGVLRGVMARRVTAQCVLCASWAAAAGLCAPVWVSSARAQSATAPSPGPEPAAAASAGPTTSSSPVAGPALIPYADASFGFEMSLPAGWALDRARFQDYEGSLGLLRGRCPAGQHSLQIVIFREFRGRPFEEWVLDFAKLLVELSGGAPAEAQAVQHDGRHAAVIEQRPRVGGSQTLSCYLCVEFDPSTRWVFSYVGAAPTDADARRVRAEFDALAATVKVHLTAETTEIFAASLERGQELIRRLRRAAGQIRPDAGQRHYEIRIAGQPSGYLTREFSEEEQSLDHPRYGGKRKHGLRLQERVWRFSDDGTVRYTRIDAFTSFDLRSELIQTRETQFSAPDISPPQVLVKTDQCIREDGVFFSSFRTSLDRDLPDPSKPFRVGPAYLDLVWARLLPGLLIDAAHEPHAFAVYDSGTRALTALSIHPHGPEPGGAPHADERFVFEVREGFLGPISRLLTDERGNLIRLTVGDLEIEACSAAVIEDRYGPRRDAARSRLRSRED